MDNNYYNSNTGVYYVPPTGNTPYQPYPQYQQYPTTYVPSPKKVYNPLGKKDGIFLLLYFFASFLVVDFGFFHGFHLGFTIAYFALFALTTAYLYKKENKVNLFSSACGVISLAGAVTFSLYNNYFINTVMVFLITGLFIIYSIGLSSTFEQNQGSYKMLYDIFGGTVSKPLENLPDVFGSAKASINRGKGNFNAIIGAALALPVLLVIIPLLIESDAAFEGLVKLIAKNVGIYILELIIAIVVLPYVFSFMHSKKYAKSAGKSSQTIIKSRIPVAGSVSFLCVISFTYLVYLFSQLAYFFSAFSGLLPDGYDKTASEFARRGFFEMFAICAINIVMISVVSAFSKQNAKGKTALSIKLLSLFISLFSVLMIFTAIQKMKLNISIYGYTINRLLVSVFMIMMLLIIAFFILHIFVPKVRYMQPIILVCSCIFVVMSFANLNAVVAAHNINAYNAKEIDMLDMEEIDELGDAAVPYLIKLTGSDDKDIAKKATHILAERTAESFDEDGEFTPYSKDFRNYCKTGKDAYDGLYNYYSSSDCPESYKKLVSMYQKTDYYDEYQDAFYDYAEGVDYYYNDSTGDYEPNSEDVNPFVDGLDEEQELM